MRRSFTILLLSRRKWSINQTSGQDEGLLHWSQQHMGRSISKIHLFHFCIFCIYFFAQLASNFANSPHTSPWLPPPYILSTEASSHLLICCFLMSCSASLSCCPLEAASVQLRSTPKMSLAKQLTQRRPICAAANCTRSSLRSRTPKSD